MMGLFGLGSKKEDKKVISSSIPQFSQQLNLPEFPSIPDENELDAEFPKYESSVADIKNAVNKGNEDEFTIPIRSPPLNNKNMFGATMNPPPNFNFNVPENIIKKPVMDQNKPLFVKMDKYKEAMKVLDELKLKIDDAEILIKSIEDIKSEEEAKLQAWKKDLQNIKEKLNSIDNDLFEV